MNRIWEDLRAPPVTKRACRKSFSIEAQLKAMQQSPEICLSRSSTLTETESILGIEDTIVTDVFNSESDEWESVSSSEDTESPGSELESDEEMECMRGQRTQRGSFCKTEYENFLPLTALDILDEFNSGNFHPKKMINIPHSTPIERESSEREGDFQRKKMIDDPYSLPIESEYSETEGNFHWKKLMDMPHSTPVERESSEIEVNFQKNLVQSVSQSILGRKNVEGDFQQKNTIDNPYSLPIESEYFEKEESQLKLEEEKECMPGEPTQRDGKKLWSLEESLILPEKENEAEPDFKGLSVMIATFPLPPNINGMCQKEVENQNFSKSSAYHVVDEVEHSNFLKDLTIMNSSELMTNELSHESLIRMDTTLRNLQLVSDAEIPSHKDHSNDSVSQNKLPSINTLHHVSVKNREILNIPKRSIAESAAEASVCQVTDMINHSNFSENSPSFENIHSSLMTVKESENLMECAKSLRNLTLVSPDKISAQKIPSNPGPSQNELSLVCNTTNKASIKNATVLTTPKRNITMVPARLYLTESAEGYSFLDHNKLSGKLDISKGNLISDSQSSLVHINQISNDAVSVLNSSIKSVTKQSHHSEKVLENSYSIDTAEPLNQQENVLGNNCIKDTSTPRNQRKKVLRSTCTKDIAKPWRQSEKNTETHIKDTRISTSENSCHSTAKESLENVPICDLSNSKDGKIKPFKFYPDLKLKKTKLDFKNIPICPLALTSKKRCSTVKLYKLPEPSSFLLGAVSNGVWKKMEK